MSATCLSAIVCDAFRERHEACSVCRESYDRTQRAILSAEEREVCRAVAFWMMSHGFATGHGDTLDTLLNQLVAEARRIRDDISNPVAGMTWRAYHSATWPKLWGIERVDASNDEEAIVPPCMSEDNAKAAVDAHNEAMTKARADG